MQVGVRTITAVVDKDIFSKNYPVLATRYNIKKSWYLDHHGWEWEYLYIELKDMGELRKLQRELYGCFKVKQIPYSYYPYKYEIFIPYPALIERKKC